MRKSFYLAEISAQMGPEKDWRMVYDFPLAIIDEDSFEILEADI